MRRIIVLLLCLMFQLPAFSGIKTTKHNLSITGTGSYKASSETRICNFCHVPHGATPAEPLWNHASTTKIFTPYDQSVSLTLKSNPGQPDGASKLCLGCHDGTVALGSTVSGGMVAGLGGTVTGSSLIGTNLSKNHPVSFVYDNVLASQNKQLVAPANLTGSVKLDKNAKLQCTACHDPHDNVNGKFLVQKNSGGALCVTCHNKSGWNTAIHAYASKDGKQGCNACHESHAAGAVPLLRKDSVELCYDCHGTGQLGPNNIKDQFSGTASSNGAGSAGSYTTVNTHHDVSGGDQNYSGAKLVCANCHNPHAVKPKTNTAGMIENLVDPFDRNVIWSGGGATDYRGSIINFCLKCHSGSFPPSVANPNKTIDPSSAMINIGNTYKTDWHGSGTARPTANNASPPVIAMACTDCHNRHGSHYNDQAWDGNVYHFNNTVDGSDYADNGAEAAAPISWAYKSPSSSKGMTKSVRVRPDTINTSGDANNLNNLCKACHSKTSGPAGIDHVDSYGSCTNCHHHGNPINAGGL